LATGGSKAVKELEKEQKTRASRMVRDFLDASLLDISSLFRDVLIEKINPGGNLTNKDFSELIKQKSQKILDADAVSAINLILRSRESLTMNSSPILTTESLFSKLSAC
jgi:DNA polymerase-3 subunit delta'